jgi:hypothetical protein
MLIAAKKAADHSTLLNIANQIGGTEQRYGLNSTFRLIGGALGAGEYVQLQYHDGVSWRVANINANQGKILDSDNSICTVYGNMKNMRIYKSITASDIGVEVV